MRGALRGRSCPNALLAAFVAAGAAAADSRDGAAASARYPFAVRLKVDERAVNARFKHWGSGFISAPPNPAVTVDIGVQARDAYSAAVSRMFQSGSPAADLEISAVQGDVDWDAEGWHAVVEHTIVLRSASGDEVARWNEKARAHIAGLAESAIPSAFAEAASTAAKRFELSFEEPSAVATWLAARGVERRSFVQSSSFVDRRATVAAPPRGKYVAYLDAGAGVLGYLASSNRLQAAAGSPVPDFSSTTRNTTDYAFEARAGFSGPWLFGQLAVARWGSTMENEFVHVTATSLGFDAGPSVRLGDFEIVAGPGVHWISAEVTEGSAAASRTVPSAFAAVRLVTGISVASARLRIGVEGRKLFGATLRFPPVETATSRSWRELALADSVGLFLGFELPVVRR